MTLSDNQKTAIAAFLQTTAHVDCETTTTDETAEIIEIAVSIRSANGEINTFESLFKPTNPIRPETSGVNNISNAMVGNAVSFADSAQFLGLVLGMTGYYVAHNAEFDLRVIATNIERTGIDVKPLQKDRTLCSMRLARHLLVPLDNPELRFNQQYLRYFFDLTEVDGQAPHRAGADTKVNLVLFGRIVELLVASGKIDAAGDIGKQLHDLCWSPIPVIRWPHRGKHQGTLLTEIPTDYFEWALRELDRLKEGSVDFDNDLAIAVTNVLGARLGMS
jgi:exodeoxyribonuclease X